MIHQTNLKHLTDGSKALEDWADRLTNNIVHGDGIFNADETGLFYRATPDRSLVLSTEDCKGRKKSKERLIVLLCSNSTGTEKLKLIVIGKCVFIYSSLFYTTHLIFGRSRHPR